MTGASIETTLELWASSLRDVKERMRGLFTQERVAASAGLFLDGLLSDERRKTGWMRAEAAGDPGPWRQQAILGRGRWNADALRDIVRDYVVENLATDDAVLVIDETGFLKQGKASCGVSRQYTGSAGKITNCQIGVFAAYVSARGHAFIDRALYLPKSWIGDPVRLGREHSRLNHSHARHRGCCASVSCHNACTVRHIAGRVGREVGRKRWDALTRYLDEDMAEMDNNIAERSIRSIAIGRKNWLFTGSKAGGTRAAAIYSVIGTCQLNGVEPQAYITDVIEKIASDWPASRWDELMPWNWTDNNLRDRQAA